MLVVTANWAVSDGTLVATPGPRRIARAWLQRVRLATIRSGFGRDGSYRPPSGLDVVLAGDTLDCLASAAWRGRDRPWHAGARASDVRRTVLLQCLRRATPLLAGLAALARRGLAAPAADRRGRPSSTATTRVPVSVTLLAGDRDRQIVDLAAAITARKAVVAQVWCDGAVLVRHGHEFDPACHVEEAAGRDRPPTLDESVAVDLVARFITGLHAAGLPARAVAPLSEALAASAAMDIPGIIAAWLAADVAGSDLGIGPRRALETAWQRAVDAWVRDARRSPPDVGLGASPVEELAAWFASRAGGEPPPALANLRGSLPVVAAVDGRAETLVLGHPARPTDATPLICLGRPAVRRWRATAIVRADGAADAACVAPGPTVAEPATIVAHRSRGTTVWRRISENDAVHPADLATAVIVDAA